MAIEQGRNEEIIWVKQEGEEQNPEKVQGEWGDLGVRHNEELLSLLEMEEKRFQVEKESMERNLVEVEKHEIVLR